MMRFLPFLLFLLLLVCSPIGMGHAIAQDAVKLRTGKHDGYTRLVFEWPSKPQYTLSKEGSRLTLRFAKAGSVDMAGIDTNGNIRNIETVSAPREPLQLAVTIAEGSRFRDFTVGSKVILDVYNSEPQESKTPSPQTAPQQQNVTKPAEKQIKPSTVTPAQSAAPAVPVEKVEAAKVDVAAMQDHIISLTSTASYGVASFIRSGFLWIVADNPGLDAKPVITGPQKELFASFTEEKVNGGIVFKTEIPDGLKHAWSDGGGIGWRIHLTSRLKEGMPANIMRNDGILAWDLSMMRKKIIVKDPLAGDEITVITAPHSDQFAGVAKNFAQLTQLESIIGLAYVPKVDNLTAEILPDKVTVEKPGGLALFTGVHSASRKQEEPPPAVEEHAGEQGEHAEHQEGTGHDETAAAKDLPTSGELQALSNVEPSGNNIYNFPRWEMGGIPALPHNMRLITLDNAGRKESDRIESVITMAKVNIANDRAPEALGLLRIAEQSVPELTNSAEFLALRGAASALAGKYDVAFSDFTEEELTKFSDVPYWRAYTLAGLEDWKQAGDTLPKNIATIAEYPDFIRVPLLLTFTEIALRGGNVPFAESILGTLRPVIEKMPYQYQSAYKYLTGEAARQKGDVERSIENWTPLVKGKDYLYRAKAGLSLTRLELDQKKITPAQAIDRLEALRYSWRGDELETLINFRLGEMYIQNKEYLKGLTVLRNAMEIVKTRDLANEIDGYMKKSFREVFTKDQLNSMNPLEAISFYEEFKDLTPPGEEGNRFVETLAERLVNADLLGRAASLLEYQVNNKLQGDKKAEIAIRLAAIRLLDGNPDGAIRSLDIAQSALNGTDKKGADAPAEKTIDIKIDEKAALPEKAPPEEPLTTDSEKQRQINLLRARALSMQKKTDQAMAVLEGMRLDPDVNRLRTDIAWGAGKWEEAAVALNDLIIAEGINPRGVLNDYQAGLILNRAIALNLSNDRVALANLRQRHSEQMDKTDKGKLFEVVTRPRRPDMIGSREAIESMISELSLFQGFIDGYGGLTKDTAEQDKPPEKSAVPKPVPADAKAGEPTPAAANQEAAGENPPAAAN